MRPHNRRFARISTDLLREIGTFSASLTRVGIRVILDSIPRRMRRGSHTLAARNPMHHELSS